RPDGRKNREEVGSCPLNYLQCLERFKTKTPGKRSGSAVAPARSMDPTEFDRLVARASNPRLIPGIYNYCDGRCPRCSFTDRCLTYLDCQELKSGHDGAALAETVGESLQRTLEMITEVARREGLDL